MLVLCLPAVTDMTENRSKWVELVLPLCVFSFQFGVNAIGAYAGSSLTTCVLAASGPMAVRYWPLFAATLSPLFGPSFASFAFVVSFTGAFGLLMWWFRRRGWRITI